MVRRPKDLHSKPVVASASAAAAAQEQGPQLRHKVAAPFASRMNIPDSQLPRKRTQVKRNDLSASSKEGLSRKTWKGGVPNVKVLNLRNGEKSSMKDVCEDHICVIDFWLSRSGSNSAISMDA